MSRPHGSLGQALGLPREDERLLLVHKEVILALEEVVQAKLKNQV